MANRYRDKNIFIRVTEIEKEIIKRKSIAAGYKTINSYAHNMLLNGIIIKVDLKDILKLNTEINKIGTNINQIAYKANSSNRVTPDDIINLQLLLSDVQNIQAEMIKKLTDR